MSEKVKGILTTNGETVAAGHYELRPYWPPPESLEDLPQFEKLRHHRKKLYETKRTKGKTRTKS